MILKWYTCKGKQHAYVHRRGTVVKGLDYDANISLCGESSVMDDDSGLSLALSCIDEEYEGKKCCKKCKRKIMEISLGT
jgi:hypothetical protein